MPGSGLPDATSRFPEAKAKQLTVDMLSALSYIHANGIVHRDIKVGAARGQCSGSSGAAVAWQRSTRAVLCYC